MIELRIIGLVIFGLGVFGLGAHYLDLREKAAQGEVDARKLEAITGLASDSAEASSKRRATDEGVAISRAEYIRLFEEANRNDPALADRADAVFPERLRELAQQRRLARERFADPAAVDRE